MSTNVEVQLLTPDDWGRVRRLRLASLRQNPEAFGGSFDAESEWTEMQWRECFSKVDYVVAVSQGMDVAIMSVEVLDGDFGATCWIGGCWSDPMVRGTGVFREMMKFVDDHAASRGWHVQGLGVWTANSNAIGAYRQLGFTQVGDEVASTWHPGQTYIRMIRKSAL